MSYGSSPILVHITGHRKFYQVFLKTFSRVHIGPMNLANTPKGETIMTKAIISTLAFTGLMTLTAMTASGAQSRDVHVTAPQTPHDQAVTLGAGDNLGRACFARYVTTVRAEQQLEIREAAAPVAKPVHPTARLMARADETASVHHMVAQVLDRVLMKLRHNA